MSQICCLTELFRLSLELNKFFCHPQFQTKFFTDQQDPIKSLSPL